MADEISDQMADEIANEVANEIASQTANEMFRRWSELEFEKKYLLNRRALESNVTEEEISVAMNEMRLFDNQDRRQAEKNARLETFKQKLASERAEFEEKIRLQKLAFKRNVKQEERLFSQQEMQLWQQGIEPHAISIAQRGVHETRKRTIPAYTFTHFTELPPEIQTTIWSLAARLADSKIHVFHRGRQCNHDENGSSRIDLTYKSKAIKLSVPTVLQVCSASRKAAEEVYTKLPVFTRRSCELRRETYFNTLYDCFYIENTERWGINKIIFDIFVKYNCPHLLSVQETADLALFQRIRNLALDFPVFATLPPTFFATFNNLKQLTVVIYPFYTRPNIGLGDSQNDIEFTSPPKGSRYSKRAKWVLAKAVALVNATNTHNADVIAMPKVDVVLRKTGIQDLDVIFDFDFESLRDEANREIEDLDEMELENSIEQNDTESDSDFFQEDDERYSDEIEMEYDDYKYDDVWWYKHAKKALEYTIGRSTLANLKVKYPLMRNPACGETL